MQRFSNGYKRLTSEEYKKELQGRLNSAKETKEKASKAYGRESANKEDVAKLRESLQDMLVRQAELHSFLGRASDDEIASNKFIKSLLANHMNEIKDY